MSSLLDPASTDERGVSFKHFYGPSVVEQFPDGNYPTGQIMEYAGQVQAHRQRDVEVVVDEKMIGELREAAEAHRQIRKRVLPLIKPGMLMMELVNLIENGTRTVLGERGLKSGIAFPTGVSRNSCAAHWTPNPGDKTRLEETDLVKIDFGTHVNGRIIDSAFSFSFDGRYEGLKRACKEATECGIREAGIDVRLGELGGLIQEVMESHEVEIGGRMLPVKCIRNLNGHSIAPYHIHAGKTVPIVKTPDTARMEEGEVYAIETFGSTGKGVVRDGMDCSHYMLNFDLSPSQAMSMARTPGAKSLLNNIRNHFGTLAWCKRYLERTGETKYQLSLKHLVDAGVVDPYPPLVDSPSSFTAQAEHTILLKSTCKEVLSRGDDY